MFVMSLLHIISSVWIRTFITLKTGINKNYSFRQTILNFENELYIDKHQFYKHSKCVYILGDILYIKKKKRNNAYGYHLRDYHNNWSIRVWVTNVSMGLKRRGRYMLYGGIRICMSQPLTRYRRQPIEHSSPRFQREQLSYQHTVEWTMSDFKPTGLRYWWYMQLKLTRKGRTRNTYLYPLRSD